MLSYVTLSTLCLMILLGCAGEAGWLASQAKTEETPLLRSAATVATSELKKVPPCLQCALQRDVHSNSHVGVPFLAC